MPSRRPLVVTGAVALVSCTALVLGVVQGWLGPDLGRGATFCEASRAGLVKQPANTFSNLGFVAAGLLIAWHLGRTSREGRVLGRGVGTAYAVIVVLLGPGSSAMHATQSACGGRLDLLSMYLVASFGAAWAIARLLRRPRALWPLLIVLVIGCELVATLSGDVPVVRFSGNLAFATLLVTALFGEVMLARRPGSGLTLRWGVAALITMLVAFAIWIADQHGWCDPDSLLQGHAVWHLLNAVAAYFLYRHYAAERERHLGATVSTAIR